MPPRTAGRTVWRLTSARYGDRAFDGEGARIYGGRWNHPGVSVVYCSSTLSLAALEYFVHVEPELAPPNLVAVAADLPPGLEVETLEVEALPANWRTYPGPERLRDLGTGWLRSGRTAVLQVPSSVIPHEMNVLLNPAHPDFARISLHAAQPFFLDPRLWKGVGGEV
jgi:RES domain-containing protein